MKCLYVSLFFMPKKLFCNSFLTIQYMLGNKIKGLILIHTYAIRFGFIHSKKIVCHNLEIKPQHLTKPKPIQRFDNRATKSIL